MHVWDQSLSVGEVTLDEQHREFFDKINQFELAGREGKSPEKVGEMLEFMVDYAKLHFLEEERYMLENHFDGLDEHARTHAAFVKQLVEFLEQFRTSGATPELAAEIAEFAGKWLTYHIKHADMQYKRFMERAQEPA